MASPLKGQCETIVAAPGCPTRTGDKVAADRYRDIFRIFEKTEQDSLSWNLDGLAPGSGIHRLMFLNAHAVTTAAGDDAFARALLNSDHLLRDGVGTEIAFKALGLRPTENLNGTDLIHRILDRLKTRRIAVWGSSEAALEKLRQRLEGEGFANLAPMQHGFHDDAFYIDEFREVRPEIVVLCMGMPRQELLAGKLEPSDHACLVICAGGWANFHSGHIARAPKLFRQLKLEWLHRLASEPRRVGRRYTLGIASFFVTVWRARKASRRASP